MYVSKYLVVWTRKESYYQTLYRLNQHLWQIFKKWVFNSKADLIIVFYLKNKNYVYKYLYNNFHVIWYKKKIIIYIKVCKICVLSFWMKLINKSSSLSLFLVICLRIACLISSFTPLSEPLVPILRCLKNIQLMPIRKM